MIPTIVSTLPRYEFTAGTPVFSINWGTYPTPQYVVLSTTTQYGEIFYTTDGSSPSRASIRFTGPLLVSTSETLQARAYKLGLNPSSVSSVVVNINLAYPPVNAETSVYEGRVVAAGGTISEQHLLAVDSFITRGKHDGWWSKIVDCCPFLGDTMTACLVKLVQASGTAASYTKNGTVSIPDNAYDATKGINLVAANEQYLGTDVVPYDEGIDPPNLSLCVGADPAIGWGNGQVSDFITDTDSVVSIGSTGTKISPDFSTTMHGFATACSASTSIWVTVSDGMTSGSVDGTNTYSYDVTSEMLVGKSHGTYDTYYNGYVSFIALGQYLTEVEMRSLTSAVRLLQIQARSYDFGIMDFAIGDSITLFQYSPYNPWVAKTAIATGAGWCDNFSISGSDTETIATRVRGFGSAMTVRYAYCMMGANNIYTDSSEFGDPVKIQTHYNRLVEFATAAKAVGATPVITSVTYYYTVTMGVNLAWEEGARQAAADSGSIFIPCCSPMINSGDPAQYFNPSDIHMNQAGHDFVACLAEAILTNAWPVLGDIAITKTGSTTADMDVVTTGVDGYMYFVVTDSATVPTGAQIIAGQDHTGGAPKFAANYPVSIAGTVTGHATGLDELDMLYYAYAVHVPTGTVPTGNIPMSLVTSTVGYFVMLVSLPVLSNLVEGVVGGEDAAYTVDTTGISGTLYFVVTESATQPSNAQIIAGQDNTGAAAAFAHNQEVTQSGTQNLSAVALAGSTPYYIYVLHAGITGLQSNVVSDGFTTAVWTPASLGSNLVAWFKADAGVYSDNGVTPAVNDDPVQEWHDQSGNDIHFYQETAADRPILKTTGFRGEPALLFNELTVEWMHSGYQACGALLATNKHSFFAVARMSITDNGGTYSSNARLLSFLAGTGGDWGVTNAVGPFNRNAGNMWSMSSDHYYIKANVPYVAKTDTIFGRIEDGANATMYNDNVAGAPVAMNYTLANNGHLGIGAQVRWTGTAFENYITSLQPRGWHGPIAEVVIANTNISAVQRQNLHIYLRDKYSLDGSFYENGERLSPLNMTNNTTPVPYVATASSSYLNHNTWYPYRAFNSSGTDYWGSSTTPTPHWVQLDMSASVWIKSYGIVAGQTATKTWVDWTLSGSDDDFVTSTVVDTQTGQSFSVAEEKTFVMTNAVKYRYWRFTITKSSAGDNLAVEAATIKLFS